MNEAEARAALEAKDANADCPACGRNSWGTVAPGEAVLRLRTAFSERAVVVPVLCGHCGFLKMHHKDTLISPPVEDWERRPAAPF